MPPLVRLGDICSGHGCWPPRPCIMGSPNVLVNGLPAHRLGDLWGIHLDVCKSCFCQPCESDRYCHGGGPDGGVLVAASLTILINGLPAARIGDPLVCGSVCATGSLNVIGGM